MLTNAVHERLVVQGAAALEVSVKRSRSLYMALGVVGLFASGLLGCSGDDPAAEVPVPAEGLAAPPAGAGLQLELGRTVPSGEETHFCRHYVLPEGADLEVSRLEHSYSPGTHHLIAYRTSLTAAEVTPDVFECGNIPGAFVYSTQVAADESSYPPGVGMRFKSGEVIRLESHFVNTTADDLEASLRLNLWYAEAPITVEAGSFFLYDRDIVIPPRGAFTARMHCEIPEDIEVLFLAPHTHVRGVAQRAWVTGGGLDAPRELLTSTGYGDLETRFFDAPIPIKAGQAIDFECDYENESAETIVEGPSKNDNEMCLILGGYYPRLDTPGEWCTLAGSGPIHEGTGTCAQALQCSGAAESAVAAEQCFFDVCPASSRAINDLTNCGFNNCSEVCPFSDKCQACVVKNCVPEFNACQQSTCDAG